ncbi:hypothetical protein BU26DRAFT_508073 [Trematosphaeria pertusa]|uniref:Uncharacterized protein n=1 Tax=Trematosphaeria pertusa TaxID=390896 RepID=A0A6A6I7C6_9PLEO|nr:uncharacterized protein BU26DRAFT_508073 [Trematosphaeria pertusa]KAF2245410.1 hypothetical protein BU26DRAFT_508073 [Trematosphaeria pertusa]
MSSNASKLFRVQIVNKENLLSGREVIGLNGGWLYNDEVKDRAGIAPHPAFRSSQGYLYEKELAQREAKRDTTKPNGMKFATPGHPTSKKIKKEQRSKPRTQEKWDSYVENFINMPCPEKVALDGIQGPLEETMEWAYPPSKFLFVGLPSLQTITHTAATGVSFRQHIFALQITKYLLGRVLVNYDEVETKLNPQIIIDSTHLTRADREVVLEKYEQNIGGLGCKVQLASIASMLDMDKRGAFVIMFQPENPLRQMFAEQAAAAFQDEGNHAIEKLPQAVLCAPWNVDNVMRDTKWFDGDRTSDLVYEWLHDRYRSIPVTSGEELEGDNQNVSAFGETHLHLRKDLYLAGASGAVTPMPGLTPLPGNSPEPMQGVSPSTMLQVLEPAEAAVSLGHSRAPTSQKRESPKLPLVELPAPPPAVV